MGGGINENGKEKKEKYFHYWRAPAIFLFLFLLSPAYIILFGPLLI